MSSNQGIEAFIVVIPEPTAFVLMALGLGAFACRRRFCK
jgi:hypothetical protein